jgi:tetratricopeptide (TPR) repeat protein/predicted Ser/Thr protein kinase
MTDWAKLTSGLEHALTLDEGAAQAFLEATIEGDDTLNLARRLLARSKPVGGFMQTGGFGDGNEEESAATNELPQGTRIDVWELQGLVGQGGMGQVYRARRADGLYEQTVALKIISRDSALGNARFQNERRRLAQLEHPGIARIVDGGFTPDGRGYMAMEFVDGRPIDDHASHAGLSRDARFSLFERLCSAVSHAHARLILHRDIKPENVLVDGSGQVRLIDFGIASELGQGDQQGPALTISSAAPEQLKGEPVSVQTDIFALGVLLHRLLTGAFPQRQADGGMAPDAARLDNRDLQAILGRCLAALPQDRYASVDALRDDIVAVLERRPVDARQGGQFYRVGKFFSRYPLASALGGLAIAALVGGLVASLNFAAEAEAEAQRANEALADAEWQYELANSNLLGQSALMDLLLQSFTGEEDAADVLTERLMGLWRNQHERWRDSPDATAALSFAVGRSLMMRRDYASTFTVYEAWFAEDYGPESLKAAGRELYAMTLFDAGRRDDAVPVLRRTLQDMQSGPRRMAVDKFNVAMRIAAHTRAPDDIALAELLLEERLAETEGLQASPLEQMEALAGKMQVARMTDNEARTVETLEELLALFERHPDIANRGRDVVRVNLSEILFYAQGRVEAAEKILTAIVEIDAVELGENAATARAARMLSDVALAKGDAVGILAWVERAIDLEAQFQGGTTQGSESLRLRRALGLAKTGQIDEAQSILAEIAKTDSVNPLERALLTAHVSLALGESPDTVTARLKAAIPPDARVTTLHRFIYSQLTEAGVGPIPGLN